MRYPHLDLIWFATDGSNNVAAFVTAGRGPIPRRVLQWDASPNGLLADKLLSLPVIGSGRMLQPYANPERFLQLAERGAYVYDWTDVHKAEAARTRSYELVCAPSVSRASNDLPDEMKLIAADASLAGVNFPEQPLLDIRLLLDCVLPPEAP